MLEIVLIALLSFVLYLWFTGVEAKEIATIHARLICDSHGYMVLDQTVAMARIQLKRNTNGHMQIKRDYTFEYTDDGDNRLTGAISVIAKKVVASRFAKVEVIH